MIIFREVKKLVKQAFGMENMFGYQTTLANQLYLMHIMLGRMLSTNKLHWQIKFVYFATRLCILCPVIIMFALYCIYGFGGNLLLMTHFAHFCFLGIYAAVTVPLANCMFGDSIDEMVHLIDRMLIERRSSRSDVQKEGIINVRTSMILNTSAYFAIVYIYFVAGTCDVILFYEEEKVKNYIYYLIPFPNVHVYGSMTFLLFVNLGVIFFIGFMTSSQMFLAVAVPLMWAAVCHNEVVHICHDIQKSCTPGNIRVVAKSYQRVARIITNFRQLFNILGTVTLFQALVMATANAYVLLLWDAPYLIKMKGICAVLISFFYVLRFCAVGETIDNLTYSTTQEIYSTRWYDLSTQHRKYILIFLCQTQATFDLSAYRAYPFRLNTVLRFANAVWSAANFLRTITKK